MEKLDKFFGIKASGSNLRTEIMAGLTTFFAMAYIVFVNPNQVAAEGANGWLAGLGPGVRILSPDSAAKGYQDYLRQLLEDYDL